MTLEEVEILNPAVEELREFGVNITNPLPADTLFVKAGKAYYSKNKMPYDCYFLDRAK